MTSRSKVPPDGGQGDELYSAGGPPAWTTLQWANGSGRSRYRYCTNPSRAEMLSKIVRQASSTLPESIVTG